MTEIKVSRRGVFLDRDGVINPYVYNSEFGTVDSPANPQEFTLLPGVGEAIKQLNHLGFLVIVVSNQPGIAKGRFSKALLDGMTRKMEDLVRASGGKIDGVYYCLHHPQASLVEYRMTCDCRKPAPGMLLQGAADWRLELKKSYMVGDGIVDILAGQAAGTTTILISPRKNYVCDELSRQGANPNYWASGLLEAVQLIRDIEGRDRPISASPGGTAGIGGMR